MCMGNDIQLSALCGLWAKAYPWQKDKKWRMDGYHRSKKGRSSLVDAAQSESFVVLMLSFCPNNNTWKIEDPLKMMRRDDVVLHFYQEPIGIHDFSLLNIHAWNYLVII